MTFAVLVATSTLTFEISVYFSDDITQLQSCRLLFVARRSRTLFGLPR